MTCYNLTAVVSVVTDGSYYHQVASKNGNYKSLFARFDIWLENRNANDALCSDLCRGAELYLTAGTIELPIPGYEWLTPETLCYCGDRSADFIVVGLFLVFSNETADIRGCVRELATNISKICHVRFRKIRFWPNHINRPTTKTVDSVNFTYMNTSFELNVRFRVYVNGQRLRLVRFTKKTFFFSRFLTIF